MRYRRARVSGGTFFFTLVTENRRPLFRHAQTVALLMECLDKIRKRFREASRLHSHQSRSSWTVQDRSRLASFEFLAVG